MRTALCISQGCSINHKCTNFVQISVQGLRPTAGTEICRFTWKWLQITKQDYTSREVWFLVNAANQMMCMFWLNACLPKTYNQWANMWEEQNITVHIFRGVMWPYNGGRLFCAISTPSAMRARTQGLANSPWMQVLHGQILIASLNSGDFSCAMQFLVCHLEASRYPHDSLAALQ